MLHDSLSGPEHWPTSYSFKASYHTTNNDMSTIEHNTDTDMLQITTLWKIYGHHTSVHGNIYHHHMGAVDAAATFGAARGLILFFFMNSVTWSGISARTSLARYAWLSVMLLPQRPPMKLRNGTNYSNHITSPLLKIKSWARYKFNTIITFGPLLNGQFLKSYSWLAWVPQIWSFVNGWSRKPSVHPVNSSNISLKQHM